MPTAALPDAGAWERIGGASGRACLGCEERVLECIASLARRSPRREVGHHVGKEADQPHAQEDEAVQFGDELPVLPIRNAVLFPGAVAPFDVGREKSVALVEDVDNLAAPVIAIFAQRDPSTDDPGKDDLHQVGCAARVLKALKHSSGNYSLILQGLDAHPPRRDHPVGART